MARHMLARRWTVVVWVLMTAPGLGCTRESPRDPTPPVETQGMDAGQQPAQGDAAQEDAEQPSVQEDAASESSQCREARDCALIVRGCCAPCIPREADFISVPLDQREAADRAECADRPLNCGACVSDEPAYRSSFVQPQCIDGACQAVDLRRTEDTRCDRDADCMLRSSACCGGCLSDVDGWIAVRAGSALDLPLSCSDVACTQGCLETGQTAEPFCSDEGYCAVQLTATESSDAGSDE